MDAINQLLGYTALNMQGFILVAARITGLFVDAPFFSHINIPPLVKVGLSVSLSVLIAPFVTSAAGAVVLPNGWALTGAIATELLIGIIFGFAVRLIFTAIQIAGQLIDYQMGFGFVNIVDPESRIQVPIMGQFLFILAFLVFILINGHHWLLQGLVRSFQLIPLNGFNFQPQIVQSLNALFMQIFVIAFKLSAPIMVSLFLVDVVYGVIGRTVPQANILVVGFPVKIGLGMLFFIYTLPLFFTMIQRMFQQIYVQADALFKMM